MIYMGMENELDITISLSNKKKEKIRLTPEKIIEKYNRKDITKEITPELKEIVKRKNLDLNKIIDTDLYKGNDFIDNSEALEDIKTTEMIRSSKRCHFFPKNECWISRDEDTGYVRYFSSNEREYFYLNVFDIFLIFNKGNFGENSTKFFNMLNVRTDEEYIKKDIINTYVEQIIEIEHFYKYKEKYPELYKIMKSTLPTLQKLNNIGMGNVMNGKDLIDGKHCFFSSTGYIASFIGKSQTTASRHINFLTLLGFINKPAIEDIPNSLLHKSFSLANRNKGKSQLINYYTINPISTELLEEANSIALILKHNKMKFRDVTHITVKKVFGKEMMNDIYENNLEKTKISYNGIINGLNNKEEISKLPF